MKLALNRRTVLAGLAATSLAPTSLAQSNGFGTSLPSLRLAPPQSFSFDALKAEAARLAKMPFKPRAVPEPKVLDKIDYAALG
ncbi:MAG: hypothetical protein POG24_03200, partial [Acidocella sp.]|nr:hypothetical protein [Acidocella sp.]